MPNGLFTTPQALLNVQVSANNTVDYFEVQRALGRRELLSFTPSVIQDFENDAKSYDPATRAYLLASLSNATKLQLLSANDLGNTFDTLLATAMKTPANNQRAITLYQVLEFSRAYAHLGDSKELNNAGKFIDAFLPRLTRTPFAALLSLQIAQLTRQVNPRLIQLVAVQARSGLGDCTSNVQGVGYSLHILAILGRHVSLSNRCAQNYRTFLSNQQSLDPLVDGAFALDATSIPGLRSLILQRFKSLKMSSGAIRQNPTISGDLTHTQLAESLFSSYLTLNGFNQLYRAAQTYTRMALSNGDRSACALAAEIPLQAPGSSPNSSRSVAVNENPFFKCALAFVDSNFTKTATYSSSLKWSVLLGPWLSLHQIDPKEATGLAIDAWPLSSPEQQIAAIGTLYAAFESGLSSSIVTEAWQKTAVNDVLSGGLETYGATYFFEAGVVGQRLGLLTTTQSKLLAHALVADKGCREFSTFYRAIPSDGNSCSFRTTIAAQTLFFTMNVKAQFNSSLGSKAI